MIKLIIPGQPIGKGRARTVRNKYTGNVHSFTPEKTASYENLIKTIAMQHFEQPCKSEIILDISAYYQIPTSASKTKKTQMLCGEIKPLTKPDLSNVIKSVEDALNGVAYFDDNQIIKIAADKRYDDNPRVEVKIFVDRFPFE